MDIVTVWTTPPEAETHQTSQKAGKAVVQVQTAVAVVENVNAYTISFKSQSLINFHLKSLSLCYDLPMSPKTLTEGMATPSSQKDTDITISLPRILQRLTTHI